MKTTVNSEYLLKLENASRKLELLEIGGVDNWEFYGISLEDYEPETEINVDGVYIDNKFSNKQKLYYNNNECNFICYIDDVFSLVYISLNPNFEYEAGNCQGCMIGDSDNKISCTCDNISDIYNLIEDSTDPTRIPLVVNTKMLHSKPLVIQRHEKEIESLEVKTREEKEKLKELTLIKNGLLSKIEEANKNIKELEEINKL